MELDLEESNYGSLVVLGWPLVSGTSIQQLTQHLAKNRNQRCWMSQIYMIAFRTESSLPELTREFN